MKGKGWDGGGNFPKPHRFPEQAMPVFQDFTPTPTLPRQGGGSNTRVAAERLIASGQAAVLITVTQAQGSVPREAGTRMVVTAHEEFGTIGGGHLEWKAIATARQMLADEDATARSEHFPLGPALGQCCGGAVTLSFEVLTETRLNAWPADEPRFYLQLYGAGHVGRAIANLLSTLNVSVDWIDERDDEFPSVLLPPHIRKVAVDAVEGEVRNAPSNGFYLVLTHQHDLDMRITEAILRRGDFGFLGLIGSHTKYQRFVHRFEERGIAPEVIQRITCPIGTRGIVGKEPEVIAVAVVAQLLSLKTP
jgi:xanthine dehydrogenase accessory factor